jgi:hypothetical protein
MQRAYRGAAEAAPSGVQGGMYVADVDADEVVVFLIGMRFNRLRRVRSWWPVFTAMPRMLREIDRVPVPGLLGARSFVSGRTLMVVQHWRSVEELGAYARDPALAHHPAWAAFNRRTAASGDVGIFHETYVVPAGSVETLYGNVPPTGLAAAHGSVPRGTRPQQTAAAERMGQVEPLA